MSDDVSRDGLVVDALPPIPPPTVRALFAEWERYRSKVAELYLEPDVAGFFDHLAITAGWTAPTPVPAPAEPVVYGDGDGERSPRWRVRDNEYDVAIWEAEVSRIEAELEAARSHLAHYVAEQTSMNEAPPEGPSHGTVTIDGRTAVLTSSEGHVYAVVLADSGVEVKSFRAGEGFSDPVSWVSVQLELVQFLRGKVYASWEDDVPEVVVGRPGESKADLAKIVTTPPCPATDSDQTTTTPSDGYDIPDPGAETR